MSIKISSRDSKESADSPEDELVLGDLVVRTAIPEDEKFRTIHVIAYILCAVIGREYSGWQPAMVHGFGFFMLMQLMAALSCLCYYLCMSEIWSAIPFSGGGYGLSRASMGFFWGFLDGSAEAFIYSAQTALSAMGLGMKFVVMFKLPSHTLLAFCFFFYAIAVYLTVQKSLVVLRRSYMALTAISIVILFMYLFGMLKYVDFDENASLHNSPVYSATSNWWTGTMGDFMFLLPFSVLPYAGVKSFGLLTIQTKDPKVSLPRAVLTAFTIIFCINMFTVFVFASQPPGILKTAATGSPMAIGNMLMFQLKRLDNSKLTTWLSIPAAFAKLLTYILPGGNLFHCLGNSYHLPPVLCVNKTKDRTNGCITCATLGMLLVIIIHFNPDIDLYNVTILITMLTNLTFIWSYFQLKTTFSTVERSFLSPLGLAGAAYTFLFFALVGVSAAFYQDTWFNLKFVAGFIAIVSVYYYTVARSTDCLCEEEDRIFLSLHVRNYNKYRKSHRKKPKARGGGKKVIPYGENSLNGSDHGSNSNSQSYSLLQTVVTSQEASRAEKGETRIGSIRVVGIIQEGPEEIPSPEAHEETRFKKLSPEQVRKKSVRIAVEGKSLRMADEVSIRLGDEQKEGEEEEREPSPQGVANLNSPVVMREAEEGAPVVDSTPLKTEDEHEEVVLYKKKEDEVESTTRLH